MSRKLLGAYLVVVLLPLGALAWLSARLAAAEVERANRRVEELARGSLRAVDVQAREILESARRSVMEDLAGADGAGGLRELRRRAPLVRQPFHVGSDGVLLYPSLLEELDREEAAFLRRTASLWTMGGLVASEGQGSAAEERGVPAGAARGWHAWHLDDGLHLLCWSRQADGSILGAELDRVRILAELVGELPEAGSATARVRLLDAEGRTLHQWGAYAPPASQRPLAREYLTAPLAAWSLEYLAAGPTSDARLAGIASGVVPWLAALVVLVLGLSAHVYRESAREIREAAQRVTFVNQVSHELKTPLTNIRMYAELLQEEVEEIPPAARHASIVAAESQRLSRLIGNVLTFGKRQRHELRIRKRPGVVDEIVTRVLEHFRPALETRGIRTESDLGAATPAHVDPDALEQILGNLLGNVEKYAASGGLARVATRCDGRVAAVTVTDRGPGVPPSEQERIFAPFHRLSNALTDGVTGTGIGLTIARDLARLHGGDLVLAAPGPGAVFQLTLDVSEAPS